MRVKVSLRAWDAESGQGVHVDDGGTGLERV